MKRISTWGKKAISVLLAAAMVFAVTTILPGTYGNATVYAGIFYTGDDVDTIIQWDAGINYITSEDEPDVKVAWNGSIYRLKVSPSDYSSPANDYIWENIGKVPSPAVPDEEETPTADFDYSGRIINLVSNGVYTINGALKHADANGHIAIEENWYGQTVTIIKTGTTDYNTTDSYPQSLYIPARPSAPTGVNKTDITDNLYYGTLTNVNTAMEYSSNLTSWIPIYDSVVTSLSAGTYYVRFKATAEAFSSTYTSITINIQSSYTVTVSGSYASTNGSGYYAAGTTVTIYAGNRNDYYFSGWSTYSDNGSINLDYYYNETTSFTMPAGNVTVTANWESYNDYYDSNYYSNYNNTNSRASNTEPTQSNTNILREDAVPDEPLQPIAVSETSPVTISPSLTLNEWSPEISSVKPYVMVQVDSLTKIGAVSPRVFTDFINGSVDFIDGVAILKGFHKDTGETVEVTMTANAASATINGQSHDIATYSGSAGSGMVSVHVSAASNFYVPLRFMTNAFGYAIDWNAQSSTATIHS